MKKYIEVEGKGVTHLKVETFYNLGGTNVFNGRNEPRGYYLSVCPVKRQKHDWGITSESYTAFTGAKILLMEVSRKSAKREMMADLKAKEMEAGVIEYICEKNGLKIVEERED